MYNKLCVLGAGSWGTALSVALSPRFSRVALWCHDADRAVEMEGRRENHKYLPGFSLPVNIHVSHNAEHLLDGAEFVLVVVPSHSLRASLEAVSPHLPSGTPIVVATKGLETGTLLRMTQVAADVIGRTNITALSGPTFAREVAAGEPAAVVVASENISLAEQVQHAFSTPCLRLYASADPVGVEIGAALKNVIAIGAGICHGLGSGTNLVAALVTRGLAEITRLAEKLGGSPRTLSGLAGLGDLVLTATGDLSRNRFVGIELGLGKPLPAILTGMSMVAEGVTTCRAAHQLGLREGVVLPIIDKMHEVLYAAKDPRQAIRELMERPLTTE